MKRMKPILILWAMILAMLPFSAFAEGWGGFEYAVGPVSQKEGRVKLRAKPSQTADVLGQYFPGTPLEVLLFSGKWAKVKIGDREGYMMREFILHDTDWAGPGEEGEWGQLISAEADGRQPLYQLPAKSAGQILRFDYYDRLLVLGTIDDDWLHVQLYHQERGKTYYGYVSSACIRKADPYDEAIINTGKANETVNFRAEPSKNGKILGKYFSGVHAYLLYDDHVAEDGWQKVRIGNEVGYIMDDFLDSILAADPPFRPSMTEIKGKSISVFTDATGKVKQHDLICYDPYQVLGIFGKYYHIKIPGLFGEPDQYGFISTGDVKEKVIRCAKLEAVTNRETPLYWGIRESGLTEQRRISKGTKVTVLAVERFPGEGWDEYIYPEAEYLFIAVEFENGGGIEAYAPIECIDYDEALEYPEIMTLG